MKFIFSIIFVFTIFTQSCSQAPVPLNVNQGKELYTTDFKKAFKTLTGGFESESTYNNHENMAKAALLLPLSGKSEKLGKDLRQAAELALFQTDSHNLILIPLDTKGTKKGAIAAMRIAVAEGADIILGPLFKDNAKAIAPIAKIEGINIVSFSNSTTLTKNGIFLLGFNPEQQVHRVINYAYNQGIRSYSSLASDNEYGKITVDKMAKTLGRKSLPIRDAQFYTRANDTLSRSINGILKNSLESDEMGAPQEALFIPEGGQMLSTIVSRLTYKNTGNKLQLLGTGQWDSPNLYKYPNLIGSWYATSPPAARKSFRDSYKKIYGNYPPRLASLAYDAIALSAVLASDSNDFSRKSLKNSRGFSGINGTFRFNDKGISERLLAVMEVTEDGVKIVDPAAKEFGLF